MAYTEPQTIPLMQNEKAQYTPLQHEEPLPNYHQGPPVLPPRPKSDVNPYASTSSPAHTHDDSNLPTIIFAIPFPAPRHAPSKQPVSPYLLYALPRAPYVKPEEDANGNPAQKEGMIKKVERKWQEEVSEGDRIRKGQEPDAGKWKKFKGKAVGLADTVIHKLPNSRIETLGRVPPKRKMGDLTILYPDDAVDLDGQPLRPEIMHDKIGEVLKETQKRATYSAVGSAFLLPVTATIDFFIVIPIFLFEMNLAYFASQFAGRAKVTAITHSKSPLTCSPTSHLSIASAVLAATCYHLSPGHFSSPDSANRSTRGVDHHMLLEAADALITTFMQHAPEEVRVRHILDREKVAEDLERCCKKAGKEYVRKVT